MFEWVEVMKYAFQQLSQSLYYTVSMSYSLWLSKMLTCSLFFFHSFSVCFVDTQNLYLCSICVRSVILHYSERTHSHLLLLILWKCIYSLIISLISFNQMYERIKKYSFLLYLGRMQIILYSTSVSLSFKFHC